MMGIPNFDDVDLGIIAIVAIIAIATGGFVGAAWLKLGLPTAVYSLYGVAITAIATLAGRKLKKEEGEEDETTE